MDNPDVVIEIARKLHIDMLFDLVVVDVTGPVPFIRTAQDEEIITQDLIVHVRPVLRGG